MTRCKKNKCGMGVVMGSEQTENLADHVYTAGEVITSKKICGLLWAIS